MIGARSPAGNWWRSRSWASRIVSRCAGLAVYFYLVGLGGQRRDHRARWRRDRLAAGRRGERQRRVGRRWGQRRRLRPLADLVGDGGLRAAAREQLLDLALGLARRRGEERLAVLALELPAQEAQATQVDPALPEHLEHRGHPPALARHRDPQTGDILREAEVVQAVVPQARPPRQVQPPLVHLREDREQLRLRLRCSGPRAPAAARAAPRHQAPESLARSPSP